MRRGAHWLPKSTPANVEFATGRRREYSEATYCTDFGIGTFIHLLQVQQQPTIPLEIGLEVPVVLDDDAIS